MKSVGVICGGFSSEFEISIKSARTIVDNFPERYKAYMVILSNEGWFVEMDGKRFPFDLNSMTAIGADFKMDAAVVYVHGDPGENGKIQAFLEIKGIPYINSGPLSSSLSFDKWYCNQFLKGFGIPVAKSIFMRSPDEVSYSSIIESLGLPIFVKPSDSGSSYGISKVKNVNDLPDALAVAFKEGRTVVLESFLEGTEVTCGIYRGQKGLVTLPLTEIVSENDFFDYEAKYNGRSKEITPARVDQNVAEKVSELSIKIYDLMQLRSIARIDFMIVKGVPHLIEVNTTPGFSPASIVPQMIKVSGSTVKDFWDEIVKVELESRHRV
ncbi:MAG: D-alanine--D-alanine ligase [Bacteroidetes bacterium]|nr:MAG: D-alanine--D-alanine ligase [Bacteroidota bacterium]